ncbi:MAG: hypothetical protein E7500_01470 [Ruminococcus sp.]|nr:hypothetical protein [Ruminococcus sp.]
MRAIILISPSPNELKSIFDQWSAQGKCDFVFNNRLSIATEIGHFFIDPLENGRDYYDLNELNSQIIDNYYFYSICFSDKDAISKFVENTRFQEGSLLDNDFGKIEQVNKLKNDNLSFFIEQII